MGKVPETDTPFSHLSFRILGQGECVSSDGKPELLCRDGSFHEDSPACHGALLCKNDSVDLACLEGAHPTQPLDEAMAICRSEPACQGFSLTGEGDADAAAKWRGKMRLSS